MGVGDVCKWSVRVFRNQGRTLNDMLEQMLG